MRAKCSSLAVLILFLSGCDEVPSTTPNSSVPETVESQPVESTPSTPDLTNPTATEVEPAIDATNPELNSSKPVDPRSDEEIVQSDVKTMLTSLYQGDVKTVLSYTYPKVIESMGGLARAEAAMQPVLAKLKNLKLISLEFPASPSFIETNKNRFVVVPTKMIVESKGQQIESLNFQFGALVPNGSEWKYFEGSRVNKQALDLLFPEFPGDYKFPETYRKKL